MSDLNDPRVFFAAERTMLAWNRTSLTLKPVEIPDGYRVSPGIVTNLVVALLEVALIVYFFLGV